MPPRRRVQRRKPAPKKQKESSETLSEAEPEPRPALGLSGTENSSLLANREGGKGGKRSSKSSKNSSVSQNSKTPLSSLQTASSSKENNPEPKPIDCRGISRSWEPVEGVRSVMGKLFPGLTVEVRARRITDSDTDSDAEGPFDDDENAEVIAGSLAGVTLKEMTGMYEQKKAEREKAAAEAGLSSPPVSTSYEFQMTVPTSFVGSARPTSASISASSSGPPLPEPSSGPSVPGPSCGPSVPGPSSGPTVPGPSSGPPVPGPSSGSPVPGPLSGPQKEIQSAAESFELERQEWFATAHRIQRKWVEAVNVLNDFLDQREVLGEECFKASLQALFKLVEKNSKKSSAS